MCILQDTKTETKNNHRVYTEFKNKIKNPWKSVKASLRSASVRKIIIRRR